MLRPRWFPLVLALALGACTASPDPAPIVVVGHYEPGLKDWLPAAASRSLWDWHDTDGRTDLAALHLVDDQYRWRLLGQPEGPLTLVPRDSSWLGLRAATTAALSELPPLSRLPLDSPDYPHLVAFLRQLTTPLLASRVRHWPWPLVPVSGPETAVGAVDLVACLREAVAIWNEGPDGPWFRWHDQPDSNLGVRLVYHPGVTTSPPMSLSLIRRDQDGRPLTMHLNVGDNYDRPSCRPYAVRAMVHELAHALLLWGHSTDRDHILWGRAPPLRTDPSADERRGAQLWRRLPPDLDLNRYGVTPPG